MSGKIKDQISKIKNAELPRGGNDLLNLAFYILRLRSGHALIFDLPFYSSSLSMATYSRWPSLT